MFVRKHFVFPLLVCCAIGLLASGFLLTTQTVHAQTQQAASTCPNRVIKGNHYTCYNRQGRLHRRAHFPHKLLHGVTVTS